jgi:hypothetical protein
MNTSINNIGILLEWDALPLNAKIGDTYLRGTKLITMKDNGNWLEIELQGPQGPVGPVGAQGVPGIPGTDFPQEIKELKLMIAELNKKITPLINNYEQIKEDLEEFKEKSSFLFGDYSN